MECRAQLNRWQRASFSLFVIRWQRSISSLFMIEGMNGAPMGLAPHGGVQTSTHVQAIVDLGRHSPSTTPRMWRSSRVGSVGADLLTLGIYQGGTISVLCACSCTIAIQFRALLKPVPAAATRSSHGSARVRHGSRSIPTRMTSCHVAECAGVAPWA